jgi:hypothetical protein
VPGRVVVVVGFFFVVVVFGTVVVVDVVVVVGSSVIGVGAVWEWPDADAARGEATAAVRLATHTVAARGRRDGSRDINVLDFDAIRCTPAGSLRAEARVSGPPLKMP